MRYPIGGDVITAINGRPVSGLDDLLAYLVGESQPGDGVVLEVLRNGGQRTEIQVVLGSRPSIAAG